MRRYYSDDPLLIGKVFDLLDIVFPGVRQVAETAKALGAPWESVSTPFLYFDKDRVVSHVGVIELSLVLMGQVTTVGSIHGVATDLRYRRRGYFRNLMEEVLDYCAAKYETLILTTEHPEYFEPFGFRVIIEHLFTVRRQSTVGGDGLRLVDKEDPVDIALLHRLLQTREPVSQVVGVLNEKAVFCFNEGSRPLHYAEDLDVIICLEMEGKRLKLFDIVGPRVPTLNALLGSVPFRVEEVSIGFATDKVAVEASASPGIFDHDGPSYFMARGPFLAESEAFTLPRSART